MRPLFKISVIHKLTEGLVAPAAGARVCVCPEKQPKDVAVVGDKQAMSMQDEIQKAIGAHGMWKQRLRTAIDSGTSDASAAVVCQDNQCAFGQWLYGLGKEIQAGSRWQCVCAAHAEFHKEAAQVLQLALSARKVDAEASMGMNGKFSNISAKLTGEMMAWRKEVV